MVFANAALGRIVHLGDKLGDWLGDLWQRNLRRIVPVGVLLISAALGLLAPRASKSTVFLVAAAAVAIAPLAYAILSFLVQRREWMPIISLIACAFIPLSVPVRGSSFVLSLVLTAVFVVLWLLRMITVERRLSLRPSPFNLPLLGWGASVLISLAWGNVFRDTLVYVWPSFPFAQTSQTLVMLALPAAFLMVANFLEGTRWLKVLVGIMLFAGFFGLVNEFVVQTIPVQTRGTFTMWIVSLALGLLLFHRGLGTWTRLGLIGLVLGWCYWSFGLRITWLASWLPTLIAAGVLCYRRSRALVAAGILAALLWAILNMNYINQVLTAEDEESGETRLAAWAMNWTVTRDHLLFGTGPAGYAVYYMTYFPTNAMATHSNYIDIISQIGLVGTGFYLWFFGLTAWRAFRLCQRLAGRGDFGECLANSVLAGSLACIVIMAFGDWVVPFAYTQGIEGFNYALYNWLLLGAIPVLERLKPDHPLA